MKGDLLLPRLASLLLDPTVAESSSFLLNCQTLTLFTTFSRHFKITSLFNCVTKWNSSRNSFWLIFQPPYWMKCRSSNMLLFCLCTAQHSSAIKIIKLDVKLLIVNISTKGILNHHNNEVIWLVISGSKIIFHWLTKFVTLLVIGNSQLIFFWPGLHSELISTEPETLWNFHFTELIPNV